MEASSKPVQETVLSDVHVTTIPIFQKSILERRSFTRFLVNHQAGFHGNDGGNDSNEEVMKATKTSRDEIVTDEDGDFLLSRTQRAIDWDVITIAHAMDTCLADVGLQVWMGCLLLCNFILSNQSKLKDFMVLELGGGTGLASIVMATVANFVICTDTGKDVLELCEKNIQANTHIYKRHHNEDIQGKRIIVRELDWSSKALKTDQSSPFCWNQKDVKLVNDVNIIIAADVIYSNDLTDAFFMKLQDLMKTGTEKTCFISTEKRLNFTMADLDVTCKEYDHFREWLKKLESTSNFLVRKLDTTMPQYLPCPQSNQLELWEIRTT